MRVASRTSLIVLAAAFVVGLLGSSGAFGSTLIARNARDVELKITKDGKALVEFKRQGDQKYILAWGAINGRAHPKCGKLQGRRCGPAQVELRHRRLFPGGDEGRRIINGPNKCSNYDGPELAWLVAACQAPDGTYWAAQSWVRIARHHGAIGGSTQELRISHWSGPLEKVVVRQTWEKARGHYGERLYGFVMYQGKPVFGLRWNGAGVPLDGFGRVIYFDTYNSGYGGGWHRLEGFLSKPIHGQFCYTIGHPASGGPHSRGAGKKYRATAMGVGVTPDVFVGPFAARPESVFDPVWLQKAYEEQLRLSRGSKFCRPQVPR
jgi:hypothetical protein